MASLRPTSARRTDHIQNRDRTMKSLSSISLSAATPVIRLGSSKPLRGSSRAHTCRKSRIAATCSAGEFLSGESGGVRTLGSHTPVPSLTADLNNGSQVSCGGSPRPRDRFAGCTARRPLASPRPLSCCRTRRAPKAFKSPRPARRLTQIPLLGLGTWNLKLRGISSDEAAPAEKLVQAIQYAVVKCGLRHIDTASSYDTEREVGLAVKKVCGSTPIKRSDLFLTTKLWNDDHKDVAGALQRSLESMQTDYLDLFLMHWPVVSDCRGQVLVPSLEKTWDDMQTAVTKGYARAIGVANFSEQKMQDLLNASDNRAPLSVCQARPLNSSGRQIT